MKTYKSIRAVYADYVGGTEYNQIIKDGFDWYIPEDYRIKYEQDLGKETWDDIVNMAYQLGGNAEEAGFVLGFIVASNLSRECFVDSLRQAIEEEKKEIEQVLRSKPYLSGFIKIYQELNEEHRKQIIDEVVKRIS